MDQRSRGGSGGNENGIRSGNASANASEYRSNPSYQQHAHSASTSSTATKRPAQQQQQARSASSHAAGANTLADLTSSVRRTSGTQPPALVGFSSTVVGNKLYVFGGRLVHVRRMVSDLYVLDLETLVWEKVWPKTEEEAASGPQPRYFHSADADVENHRLLIFGGMGQTAEALQQQQTGQGQEATQATSADGSDTGLAVLSDLLIYDTIKGEWSVPETTTRPGVQAPLARYAHLSAISNGCLVILGGQDILNRYIEQMSCLELATMTYVQNSEWKGHAGTYRSVAVARQMSVNQSDNSYIPPAPAATGSGRDRGYSNATYDSIASGSTAQLDETLQLPYTVQANPEEPVYTFTNMNFAEVRRLFDMISAPSETSNWESSVTPLSDLMVGSPSLPPGLRFPTASMVGSYLILTGTLITQQVSSFAIWTSDLSKATTPNAANARPKLTWQKIDAGSTLKSGSWNRAVAWKNTVVILGDRDRDIAIDYNRRQNNFSHVAFVDLETFGIYQPPPQVIPLAAQDFGLQILNQPMLADYEIVCSDGVRLPCARRILEERWPWFAKKLAAFRSRPTELVPHLVGPDGDVHRLSDGPVNGHVKEISSDTITSSNGQKKSRTSKFTPTSLLFPENSTVALALLQYFYTYNLITPLQHNTSTLLCLLLIGKEYDIPNLRALTVHAFHCLLDKPNGHTIAAVIYEAATLGGCVALQTRALKLMMNQQNAKARSAKSAAAAAEATKRLAQLKS